MYITWNSYRCEKNRLIFLQCMYHIKSIWNKLNSASFPCLSLFKNMEHIKSFDLQMIKLNCFWYLIYSCWLQLNFHYLINKKKSNPCCSLDLYNNENNKLIIVTATWWKWLSQCYLPLSMWLKHFGFFTSKNKI